MAGLMTGLAGVRVRMPLRPLGGESNPYGPENGTAGR